MPDNARHIPNKLAIIAVLIAMVSIQSGATLAKTLFPIIGAPGVTALRLALGTLILVVIFKPWRLRFKYEQRLPLLLYGIALGGMNYLFYLSLKTVPLGIAVALEFTGPLAVALFFSRRAIDFIWIILAVLGLWFLLPTTTSHHNHISLSGIACALGAGICWAMYIITGKKAGAENGPATVAIGSLIASVIYVPVGVMQATASVFHSSLLLPGFAIAILSTALPYSLEMIALTRLPTRVFGTLMSLEPALAAFSGILFLNEYLTHIQWLALISIIVASAGSTLTMKQTPHINQVDRR